MSAGVRMINVFNYLYGRLKMRISNYIQIQQKAADTISRVWSQVNSSIWAINHKFEQLLIAFIVKLDCFGFASNEKSIRFGSD